MQLTTHSKNYTISEKLVRILNEKLNKLQKYFDDDATCVVRCSQVGKVHKMEMTVNQKGRAFRAEVQTNNMFKNVDLALSKIEKQVVKNKERLKDTLRKGVSFDAQRLEFNNKQKFDAVEVIKTKSFPIEQMEIKDAEFAMETLDHSFYVYANKKSGKINIMYRRTDGNVGIIEVSNSKITK